MRASLIEGAPLTISSVMPVIAVDSAGIGHSGSVNVQRFLFISGSKAAISIILSLPGLVPVVSVS